MNRYTKHMKTRYRKAMNESNDCTVIATAIVARITYKAAHQTMAAAGRGNGKRFGGTIQAVQSHGFRVDIVRNITQKNGSKYTPKTIGNKLKRGYYLCYCNGHVFAVVNGVVEDWTNNRQHHITQIWKVTRISS